MATEGGLIDFMFLAPTRPLDPLLLTSKLCKTNESKVLDRD